MAAGPTIPRFEFHPLDSVHGEGATTPIDLPLHPPIGKTEVFQYVHPDRSGGVDRKTGLPLRSPDPELFPLLAERDAPKIRFSDLQVGDEITLETTNGVATMVLVTSPTHPRIDMPTVDTYLGITAFDQVVFDSDGEILIHGCLLTKSNMSVPSSLSLNVGAQLIMDNGKRTPPIQSIQISRGGRPIPLPDIDDQHPKSQEFIHESEGLERANELIGILENLARDMPFGISRDNGFLTAQDTENLTRMDWYTDSTGKLAYAIFMIDYDTKFDHLPSVYALQQSINGGRQIITITELRDVTREQYLSAVEHKLTSRLAIQQRGVQHNYSTDPRIDGGICMWLDTRAGQTGYIAAHYPNGTMAIHRTTDPAQKPIDNPADIGIRNMTNNGVNFSLDFGPHFSAAADPGVPIANILGAVRKIFPV